MKTPTKAELVSKIEKLEAKVEQDQREYESLRLRYVQKREQLENAAIQDPDNADKYQTVHPDNAHWMSSSDAYITIQTTGYDHDYDRMPKCRVCTIPVPDLTGGMRWNTQLPKSYRLEERDEQGRYTYKVSPHWELVKEDEYGQHWHHPEMETDMQVLGEQDFLIENHEQYSRRRNKEHLEKMNHMIWLAGQIQEFYNGVGHFPDEEVEVQVQFAMRGEVG
tara:strand:+ start:2043 stop:2705 length:663 start_codon:yes stop_codon:yes gene_type:complete